MSDQASSVLTTSRLVLAAVWLAAFAAIPSAAQYQRQLDSGVKPTEIHTVYDTLTAMVSLAMIAAWVATSRWLQVKVTAAGGVRLSPTWARWGWVVPIVSLWFPRQIVGDVLIGREPNRQQLNTWWTTWLGFSLINNLQAAAAITATTPTNPIRPQLEIAAACLLTG